ncbi:MAG: aminopeptidase P family protein [Rhodospirillales bacterium]|nr:aminopeptidase P family protein [Rhodospirillales bacterium]
MAKSYRGDDHLQSLLRNAGITLSIAKIRSIIQGVLAAPGGSDPTAWQRLIAAREAVEGVDGLEGQLVALHREMAAATDERGNADFPDRLSQLRRQLAAGGLDGFLVPRADPHQGEFLPRAAERLAWLTGFTGSAGLAVILADRAAMFIDGRYTLQVRDQADPRHYEFRHSVEEPAAAWLADNLPKGARLGYDPWLHTPNQAARYHAACQKAEAELVAVSQNPIDGIWPDRPPLPLAPVVPHASTYAGEDSVKKRQNLSGGLARDKADAAFIAAPDSVAWLLNIRGGDVPFTPLPLSFALIHADATVDLFIDERKLTGETRLHLGDGVRVHPFDGLGDALDGLGSQGKTVSIDKDASPVWAWHRLKQAGAKTTDGPDPCLLPRAKKNARELEGLRAAHRRDGAAMARFLAWFEGAAKKGGHDELSVAAKLESFRCEEDLYRGPSFETISAVGSHSAIVHYRCDETTNRRLEPGSLYLADSGGQYLDGTTDITRTVAVGEPTAEMRDRFTRVLKGHIALGTAVFPKGTTGSQLDAIARKPLWDAGLDYDHGTGHGVGSYLGVHEGPARISKMPNRVALEPGMVLSNEPGFYKAGEFGIRIENLVAVQRRDEPTGGNDAFLGFETLTLAPIDLSLIVPELLSFAEKAWLNRYHARVCGEIASLVDAETAQWLERATRPIE